MDITVRPLGSAGAYSFPASTIPRTATPLDLTRSVSKHPGKAEKLMLGDLKLGADPATRASDIDRTTDLARLINHAAPDELAYFIPTHDGPPRTGRETVAAQPDARKLGQGFYPLPPAPDADPPGWLVAFGTFAFGLSVWAFVELALVMMTDLTLPGV